ncbi:hypothetical protein AAZV13_06G113000 [Glycine max]
MALRLRLKVSSIGSPFLQLGSSASAACSVSKLGFHPPRLQLNKNSHPIRLFVRAARIESKGVTLGFRTPQFQLPEPLTGTTWTLDDFEAYPALLDGPEFMAEDAKLFGYPFPYLYDESQDVAQHFGAVCTPEFYLFKKDGRRPFELVYHGQFDDSRPSNNVPVTGRDLSLAIDRVLSGQPVPSEQKPSVGCSIKWHPGKKF